MTIDDPNTHTAIFLKIMFLCTQSEIVARLPAVVDKCTSWLCEYRDFQLFPMLSCPDSSIAHPILWLNSLCLTVLAASRCSNGIGGWGIEGVDACTSEVVVLLRTDDADFVRDEIRGAHYRGRAMG